MSVSQSETRQRRSAGKEAPGDASEKAANESSYEKGTNWTDGGVGQGSLFMPLLLVFGPLSMQWLAYLTSPEASYTSAVGLTGLAEGCVADLHQCGANLMHASFSAAPTLAAVQFLGVFNLLALVLDVGLPGKVCYGPETLTGHVPAYVDNAMAHCFVFSAVFLGASSLGLGLFDLGAMYDLFAPMLTTLNLAGLLLGVFLYFKGLHFPSTQDHGSSGSLVVDYMWGTELYPRLLGVDIKRFVNCRFSMTFWMLAGLSYAYRSYSLHGAVDYGLVLSAASQYIYLVKFFAWEIGYMRSIDIIVDRAGFEIQWGCLVWVPCLYTLHTRYLVQHPSGLSAEAAGCIFAVGMAGVLLNYLADLERQRFRETDAQTKVWGKKPVYIEAYYTIIDTKTGESKQRRSLLLASGFWGIARHFHYVFELTAAWSWCLLSNPLRNGVIPLFYATFLTILLMHRAKRDETKCQKKYGKYYDEYSKLVPYLVIPGIY